MKSNIVLISEDFNFNPVINWKKVFAGCKIIIVKDHK